jgi:hypothetical protein
LIFANPLFTVIALISCASITAQGIKGRKQRSESQSSPLLNLPLHLVIHLSSSHLLIVVLAVCEWRALIWVNRYEVWRFIARVVSFISLRISANLKSLIFMTSSVLMDYFEFQGSSYWCSFKGQIIDLTQRRWRNRSCSSASTGKHCSPSFLLET